MLCELRLCHRRHSRGSAPHRLQGGQHFRAAPACLPRRRRRRRRRFFCWTSALLPTAAASTKKIGDGPCARSRRGRQPAAAFLGALGWQGCAIRVRPVAAACCATAAGVAGVAGGAAACAQMARNINSLWVCPRETTIDPRETIMDPRDDHGYYQVCRTAPRQATCTRHTSCTGMHSRGARTNVQTHTNPHTPTAQLCAPRFLPFCW